MSSRRGRTQEPAFYVRAESLQHVSGSNNSSSLEGTFNILEPDGFSGRLVTRPVRSKRARQKRIPRELYQHAPRSIRLNGWGLGTTIITGSESEAACMEPTPCDSGKPDTGTGEDLSYRGLSESSSGSSTALDTMTSSSTSRTNSPDALHNSASEPQTLSSSASQPQIDPALLEASERGSDSNTENNANSLTQPAFEYCHTILQPISVPVVRSDPLRMYYDELSAAQNPFQLRPIDHYRSEYY